MLKHFSKTESNSNKKYKGRLFEKRMLRAFQSNKNAHRQISINDMLMVFINTVEPQYSNPLIKQTL